MTCQWSTSLQRSPKQPKAAPSTPEPIEDIQQEQDEVLSSFEAISKTIDTRIYYTSKRTTFLAEVVFGMNALKGNVVPTNQLLTAVYLHDFGMITLPDTFFGHGKPTDEQFKTLKRHPIVGCEIIAHSTEWKEAAKIILQHHERPDGKGYPQGLK